MNLHTCIGATASTSRRKRPFRDARARRTFNDTTSKEIRMQRHLIIAALLAAATTAGFAQTAASTVQRDVNQEKRIEQGLQNGTITTREAALLQRDESKVDKMQAQASYRCARRSRAACRSGVPNPSVSVPDSWKRARPGAAIP